MDIDQKYKKMALLGMFLIINGLSAAGLNLSTEFTTHATLVFTNNVTKEIDLYPGNLQRVDAFFEGFKEIQWRGMDGKMYKAGLDIKGSESWIALKIRADNAITVDRLNQSTKKIDGISF